MSYKISILILSLMLSGLVASEPVLVSDPGIPDTVKLEGGPLVVGQSRPLSFTIVNDELVGGYSLGYILQQYLPDGGFAVFDSAVYVGRMADPTILPYRINGYYHLDIGGTPPDSLMLGANKMAQNSLPSGNGQLIELYFTGTEAGTLSIDTAFFPPGGYFILVDDFGNVWAPRAVFSDIEVIEGNPPPTISLPGNPPRVTAGSTVEFDVGGSSSVGFPVTLEFVSLTGYDDETKLPDNDPAFGTGNPAEFSWVTTSADIGIWLATFEICDSSGACVAGAIDIQVVENSSQLLSFTMSSLPLLCKVSAIQHGNFDSDLNPELVASGLVSTVNVSSLSLLDYLPNRTLDEAFVLDDNSPKFGIQVGYFDADENLDAVFMDWLGYGQYRTTTFLGDGDGGFDPGSVASTGFPSRGTALGELTGDNYLDFLSVDTSLIRIYAGDGAGGFDLSSTVSIGELALSVNAADFNDDGYTDLAVGTEAGVRIYLANGSGGFTLSNSYSQTYGSLDIEITNQGSDFNNDDIFDLCISTPSVGGTNSDMVVYIGNGNGSFDQNVIRTVKGQIFANGVGDFDGDGELDIAFVNGARRYVAIMFGDGTGAFDNEIRFAIPGMNPQYIDCLDADLDGDLDIVAIASDNMDHNSSFLLLNQLDPGSYAQMSFNIQACDNADIELTSSGGKVFNQMRNTMPSGDFFRRNLNDNDNIDDFAALGVVENGAYHLTAMPKPNLPAGTDFSVEFTVDGELYRLAKDIPMSESGYRFDLYPSGSAPILPLPGKFIEANPPSFVWSGEGQYDFQLASDIDFNNLLYDVVVNDHMFQPSAPLEASGTPTYYWRVKPHEAADFDCLYAVNVGSASPSGGDANGDGLVNVADVVFLINYIFRDGAAPNPLDAGNVNCDNEINVGDAVYMIQYIFKGGPAPGDC